MTYTPTAAPAEQINRQYYLPFGGVRHTDGLNTDVGFTGQRLDGSTGLMFYQARYYDPLAARFISADTIIPNPNMSQDYNRYSYVRNNPLRYTDPSGHCVAMGRAGLDNNSSEPCEREAMTINPLDTNHDGFYVDINPGCQICPSESIYMSQEAQDAYWANQEWVPAEPQGDPSMFTHYYAVCGVLCLALRELPGGGWDWGFGGGFAVGYAGGLTEALDMKNADDQTLEFAFYVIYGLSCPQNGRSGDCSHGGGLGPLVGMYAIDWGDHDPVSKSRLPPHLHLLSKRLKY